ncbi:hypothetical protein J2741_001868 [Methanolinea mesophila]|uniref:hypothetical protein n=1 Tax=Methanolinea mesophila TaxID=547055 RepID=UPI001FD7D09F|nr:hypothetical protein [Methanolinea mesophila]MBP1929321.1 hypothetical protein [Methanolinea mesophila]
MDQNLRERARVAMRGIISAAGYEVSEVDPPLDLSAIKGNECLIVMINDDTDEIREFDSTRYTVKNDEQELSCRKLLLSYDESVRADNSVVWGQKEFMRYAGEATLARVMDKELVLSFSAEPARAEPTPRAEAPAPAGSGISLLHLPVKINRQSAEKIANTQGNATLRFMPHWYYHFVSSGEQVYKEKRIPFDSEGSGAMNAINGSCMGWDLASAIEDEVPAEADIVKPHITKEDASERIFNELVEKLTQHVRLRQVKGDAIFYEEKVIKPEKKNIAIEISQVYVPVWQIRGKKIVEINAFNGEILTEPMDEGVEIL